MFSMCDIRARNPVELIRCVLQIRPSYNRVQFAAKVKKKNKNKKLRLPRPKYQSSYSLLSALSQHKVHFANKKFQSLILIKLHALLKTK